MVTLPGGLSLLKLPFLSVVGGGIITNVLVNGLVDTDSKEVGKDSISCPIKRRMA